MISLILAATACVSSTGTTVGDWANVDEETSDGWVIYVHTETPRSDEGQDAEISGRVVAREGCVLLQGEEAMPVVWPIGTTIADSDPLTIELPSGDMVRDGDRLTGGGGGQAARTLGIEVPPECASDTGTVAMFNAEGPVEVSAGTGETAS